MSLFGFLLAFVGVFLYIAIEKNNEISIDNMSLFLGGFFGGALRVHLG